MQLQINMHQSITAKPRQKLIFIPNEMRHRRDGEVRQKLTSSQLLSFLRLGEQDSVQYRLETTDKPLSLMQQNIMTIASVDMRITLFIAQAKALDSEHILSEAKLSQPILPEKNSSCHFSASRWTIATSMELWDTVDFSQLNPSLPKAPPPKMMDFPSHDWKSDWKVPEVPSSSTCSSVHQSCALNGPRDPHTLMNANENVTDVNVKIPEFQIRKFEEMPVVITRIVNPDKFFIQHQDTNLLEISEVLLKESSGGKSFAEMKRIPDTGEYVMAWFPKRKLWCRVQVCKISDACTADSQKDLANIKVEVRRIDYGDVARVSLGNIKELCGEIASIPMQTLQVSLANVRPVNGENWSSEAISWFKSKVKKKTLYARLFPERGNVLVELFMEKGKIGAMRRGDSLSVKLAQHGYAKHEQQRFRVLRSHVQPKTRRQSLEWEKYLVSHYCQNKK
ncbi:uncharacterized protein LOC130438271 isoform X2 [Triplophysa dalaica]|uniref:uncharacterized protein LOC130438271 isoform X2 n=1 Tax=Triplophysa dalaica TaxID=1582913 RepID=UPI0024DF4730|nr:uncharacterized protein LOC130438271 isoform X2 [Triplophysa dalaica]